jgi:hypothetical protein
MSTPIENEVQRLRRDVATAEHFLGSLAGDFQGSVTQCIAKLGEQRRYGYDWQRRDDTTFDGIQIDLPDGSTLDRRWLAALASAAKILAKERDEHFRAMATMSTALDAATMGRAANQRTIDELLDHNHHLQERIDALRARTRAKPPVEDPTNFDDAIALAMKNAETRDGSETLLNRLVEEFDAAVQRVTGTVRIKLVSDNDVAPRRDFLVVAESTSAVHVLWEVEVDSSGLPVRLEGPAEDKSVTCWTLDDLRREFVTAASHATVGGKIVDLSKEVS